MSLSLPAVAVAIPLPVKPAAVLPDREIWRLALRRLAFGSRQRCPNQRSMHRPLVLFVTRGRLLWLRLRLGLARFCDCAGSLRVGGNGDRRILEEIDGPFNQLLVDDERLGIRDSRVRKGSPLRAGDE